MSLAMAQCLRKELENLHSRRNLRVVILQSKGKHFCNGGDPSSWAREAWTEMNKSNGSECQNFDVAAAAVHEGASLGNSLGNS